MKKNTIKIFLIVALLVLPLISLASAELVCCEETYSGNTCQLVDSSECASANADATSCDQTTYCALGTCVDDDAGLCSDNVRKATCEATPSGYWDSRDSDELLSCQEGCCFVGESGQFTTQVACNQIGTDHGINAVFDSSIKDEFVCSDTSNPKAKGACVLVDSAVRDCDITTKESCKASGGEFYEDTLCTADYLQTNCGKTSNTQCGADGDVYFLDSCENLANVYDANMFSTTDAGWTQEMENYWTEIQDPFCDPFDANCGDCERPPVGTICGEYSSNDVMTPERPTYGELVCRSLDCVYNGVEYKHGEEWCAETPGTAQIFAPDANNPRNLSVESLEELYNVSKYNVPGSEYTVLTCWDGEILDEQCSPRREEYCVESTIDTVVEKDFSVAWCEQNNWRECFTFTNQESCEEIDQSCKWLVGYREDFTENLRGNTRSTMNDDIQGSCVPLVAPGFEFWDEETEAANICATGTVGEAVQYEEFWTNRQSKAKDRFYTDKKGEYYREQQCYDNCYAIPGYGDSVGIKAVEEAHQGITKPQNTKDNEGEKVLSLREGYYCANNKDEAVRGPYPSTSNCASDYNDQGFLDRKIRKDFPIFFTNGQWVDFLQTRTQSLGDCGYKPNTEGKYSDISSEIITAVFQRVKGKEENTENITEEKIIFKGNDYLDYNDWEEVDY